MFLKDLIFNEVIFLSLHELMMLPIFKRETLVRDIYNCRTQYKASFVIILGSLKIYDILLLEINKTNFLIKFYCIL